MYNEDLNSMSENKALKSGIWFTASNFLMKSVGFITTPIFTRLMTKADYGKFSNFQTCLMIMLYVVSLDLEASLIRAVYDYKNKLDEYIKSLIVLSIASTGITWIISILFRPIFTSILSVDSFYVDLMFAYLLFCPAVNIFQNAERFKYKYKKTVASALSISVGASFLSVLLVTNMQDKFMGRVIGYITPTIVVGLIIVSIYIFKTKSIQFKYWKYALPITLPYIPHLLSMYLLSNIDRVMINHICGEEYVALYSLAYTCGNIVTLLIGSINSAYSAWLAEKLYNAEYEKTKKVSLPYVLIFSIFAFGMVLVTPEILLILGGKTYLEAKYVMPPVAAGCLLQFVYSMYVNVEQYLKKTKGMAAASMIAAVINIILNYIFIRKYGYIAAAYTTYAGYFILLIMHMWFVYKAGMSKVYNNKQVFITAMVSSLLIFMTNILMELHAIRYIVLTIYAVILIIIIVKNKKRVYLIIKGLR